MPEAGFHRVVRPTLKFVYAGYVLVAVLFIAALVVHDQVLAEKGQPPWLPVMAALLLLWPIQRHIRRLTSKLTISEDKLYYESGFISKATRIIQIPKIQDVRVNQSIGQRMLGVGDLLIETAGESSRLTLQNIDNPRALADKIIELENATGSVKPNPPPL